MEFLLEFFELGYVSPPPIWPGEARKLKKIIIKLTESLKSFLKEISKHLPALTNIE
jgi:hypothetical protein